MSTPPSSYPPRPPSVPPIPLEIIFHVYETHTHVNFVTSPQVCEEEERSPDLAVAGGQHGRHVREAGVLTAGIASSHFETSCSPRDLETQLHFALVVIDQ